MEGNIIKGGDPGVLIRNSKDYDVSRNIIEDVGEDVRIEPSHD